MKHQVICKELNIRYNDYTKFRHRYKFFSYITDILVLSYALKLDEELRMGLISDLRQVLANKPLMNGLDLALCGSLTCFKQDNLGYLRQISSTVNRFQEHKWQYTDISK